MNTPVNDAATPAAVASGSIEFEVNGEAVSIPAQSRGHLADFLRDRMGLTGTHLGCEHGVCGACTVLVDDAPARACIAPLAACGGARVTTVEGFGDDRLMRRLREAFTAHHALQCGYCTPGMLVSAHDIVRRLPGADEARIREELAGNLCRCTGYDGIVRAIAQVLAEAPAAQGLPQASPPRAVLGPLPRAGSGRATTTADAGGDDGQRRVTLPIPAADLWQVLSDVETVVDCVPGAELTGAVDPQPFDFRLSVAMGPLRSDFHGSARVEYAHATREAEVEASAQDAGTRSSGRGRLRIAVEERGPQASELRLAMEYTLTGPLAQFGRGALVDAVIDTLLARFAENVRRSVRGEQVSEDRPLGGLGLGLAAALRRLRAWFGR